MNDPVAGIREALAGAARELAAAGAKDELLTELGTRRRMLGLVRPPVLKPIGRVWRLGVLLLAHDGAAFATGTITRVTETSRPTFQSPAAEERRSYRALAVRSGLPMGETVNFNAEAIVLDAAALAGADGPLFLRDGEPFVRWSHGHGAYGHGAYGHGGEVTMPLDDYLRDRVELLAHPPEGA